MVMVGRLRQRIDPLRRQAERLADVADRRASPVADALRRHPRPVPAVLLVLDHLLAAFMLEIDVDVGSLVALCAHEPLEEDVDPGRID